MVSKIEPVIGRTMVSVLAYSFQDLKQIVPEAKVRDHIGDLLETSDPGSVDSVHCAINRAAEMQYHADVIGQTNYFQRLVYGFEAVADAHMILGKMIIAANSKKGSEARAKVLGQTKAYSLDYVDLLRGICNETMHKIKSASEECRDNLAKATTLDDAIKYMSFLLCFESHLIMRIPRIKLSRFKYEGEIVRNLGTMKTHVNENVDEFYDFLREFDPDYADRLIQGIDRQSLPHSAKIARLTTPYLSDFVQFEKDINEIKARHDLNLSYDV
jgi:hypothetical protein